MFRESASNQWTRNGTDSPSQSLNAKPRTPMSQGHKVGRQYFRKGDNAAAANPLNSTPRKQDSKVIGKRSN